MSSRVEFILDMKDQASAKMAASTGKIKDSIGQVSAEMKKYDQQMSSVASISMQKFNAQQAAAAKNTISFSERLKSAATAFGLVAGGVAAVGVAIDKAIDFGEQGAQVETLRQSFSALGGELDALRRASNNTVSDFDLMNAYNTLLVGTSGDLRTLLSENADELLRIAKAASTMNPALGDASFLFQSLSSGVKRGTPLLIDNAGITLKLGEANEKYAASIGKTVKELTAEEQKVALLYATLEGGQQIIEDAMKVDASNLDTFQQYTANIENMKNRFAELASVNIGPVLDKWNRVVTLMQSGDISQSRANWSFFWSVITGSTNSIEKLEEKSRDLNDTTSRINTTVTSVSASMNNYAAEVYGVSERLGEAESASKHVRSATEAVRDVAGRAAEEMKLYGEEVASAFESMWGAANRDWGGAFAGIMEGSQFVQTGGLSFGGLSANLEQAAGMAARQGEQIAKEYAPQIEQAAKDSELAWLQYQVSVGDMTAVEAQKQAVKDLGISNSEAYLAMTRDVGDWESAIDTAAVKIQSIIEALARLDGTSANISIYIDEIANRGSASQGGYGTGGQRVSGQSLFAQARGGPLQNAALLGDGGGPEMVINGWVFTAEETKHLLAAGIKPTPYATGGPLIDGEYIINTTNTTSYSSVPTSPTRDRGGGHATGTAGNLQGSETSTPSPVEQAMIVDIGEISSSIGIQSQQLSSIQAQQASMIARATTDAARRYEESTDRIIETLDVLIAKTAGIDGIASAFKQANRSSGA